MSECCSEFSPRLMVAKAGNDMVYSAPDQALPAVLSLPTFWPLDMSQRWS